MKTIKHQIEIDCDQETVFDLSQDYSRRLDWDPYLSKAYLLKGAEKAGLGVESCCRNRSGSEMITRYISFKRPRVAAVTMVKGPWFLKRFGGAWNVSKLSETRSSLVFTYNFQMRGGLLGYSLLPFAIFFFSREMKSRLFAIKRYLESDFGE